jgi:hypothetical protein
MNLDADNGFLGIDQNTIPEQLPAGILSDGRNIRIEGGVIYPRGGHLATSWTNYDNEDGLSIIYNARDMITVELLTGEKGLLVAAKESANYIRCGATMQTVGYPDSVLIEEDCTLKQAFDKVYLFRDGKVPLVWEAGSEKGFEYMEIAPYDSGFLAVPSTAVSAYAQSRMLYGSADDVLVSDILGPSNINVVNRFYVDSGQFGAVTAIEPLDGNRVLIAKSRSLAVLNQFTGDLSDVSLAALSNQIGIIARKSIVSVGNERLFLSHLGVYKVSQALEDRLEASDIPISRPIEPTIQRINWDAAYKAVGVVYGGRYYLAIPVDGSIRNNCVIVYNLISEKWESIDESYLDGFEVVAWGNATIAGKLYLMALSSVGYVYQYAVDVDPVDRAGSGFAEHVINTVKTRIYGASLDWQTPLQATIHKETWAAAYNISERTNLAQQRLVKAATAGDRDKSLLHGQKLNAYTSPSFDRDAYGREDYSLDLSGDGQYLGELGASIELHRPSIDVLRLRGRGGAGSQLIFQATEGSLRIRAVQMQCRYGPKFKHDRS